MAAALVADLRQYLFETREEKLKRIYEESAHQTKVAINRLSRETGQLQKSIDKEKSRAKRESKKVGVDAVRSCATNIVMLRKQIDKNVWMRCRLQAVLDETVIARGQVNMIRTIALLSRGMAVLNSNDHFRDTCVNFQKQARELQFKNEQYAGQITFDSEDFFEEEEADGILDEVIAEIMVEIKVSVPTQPIDGQLAADAQLAADELPDVEPIRLQHRLNDLTT